MDGSFHEIAEARIDHAMPLNHRLPFKLFAHYHHVKMPSRRVGFGLGMSGMSGTIVTHFNVDGRERFC
jgi:hypothetical protein